VISILKVINI